MFLKPKNGDVHQADREYFTVYDSKSRSYTEPFPAMNKDVVLRDFLNAFNHPEASTKNTYYRNAEDYSVFRVGTFDLQSGELRAHQPEHVANLHDIRSLAQPKQPPRDVQAL
nr:MAG: nonstructural protein [Microvirus sp.]